VGLVQLASRDNPYLGGGAGGSNAFSEQTARIVDAEIRIWQRYTGCSTSAIVKACSPPATDVVRSAQGTRVLAGSEQPLTIAAGMLHCSESPRPGQLQSLEDLTLDVSGYKILFILNAGFTDVHASFDGDHLQNKIHGLAGGDLQWIL
jgi:hypothetical protein